MLERGEATTGTEPRPWTARGRVALSSPLPTLAAQLCLYGRPLQMRAIVQTLPGCMKIQACEGYRTQIIY